MVDEEKKSRGFGFISFEEYSSAQACLKQRFVDICGKQVTEKLMIWPMAKDG